MDLYIISGLSGGGKSTVLRALEDLGVYCVDNIAIPLLPELLRLARETDPERALAVGVDAREPRFLAQFPAVHKQMVELGLRVEVVFVEAERDVLVRRYSETRRMHPMGELPEAIDRERDLLEPVRSVTERPIETSTLSSRQLRQLIRDRYGARGTFRLVLTSFAFRLGVPSEADMIFDARFLNNPHDDDALRPMSGLDQPVSRFVLTQPDAQAFVDQLEALARFVIPRSVREGRSYLTISVGCTGGRHRSVAVVEELKRRFAKGGPLCDPAPSLVVRHRDVGASA